MRSSLPPLGPPVSRDRVITSFPKWYTPAACLQLREHFHGQVSAACQRGNTGTLSKVVVVGDLYVGKTSLIHRFCKNVFNRDYKATIGVDFEIERFEVAGIPFSLQIWDTAGQEKFKCIASAYYRGAQVIITAFDLTDVQTLAHTRQWLEDALRENEPGACFLFLVGTKKDLLVSRMDGTGPGAASPSDWAGGTEGDTKGPKWGLADASWGRKAGRWVPLLLLQGCWVSPLARCAP
uniref:Ras-related protein Rab-36 n=1 Tax=Sus scrofa TaxID=9823 RepID=A0A8D0TZK2_PIG